MKRKFYKRTVLALLRGRQGNLCAYCHLSMFVSTADWASKQRAPTLDHVIPKSKGGKTHECNLVAACLGCNSAKADAQADDFVMRRT